MLVKRWASVADAGPALYQHCVNFSRVSCDCERGSAKEEIREDGTHYTTKINQINISRISLDPVSALLFPQIGLKDASSDK